MNIQSALDEIKTLLGYPLLDDLNVTDDMILTNINRAFKRAKPFFNFTDFIYLPNPNGNVIDCTQINPPIIDVIHVYESPISKYSIVDPDVFYMRNFYNMMAMARLFMAMSEIELLVSRDFMFVNGKLYLNEYWSSNITVEAIFDYQDPSQFDNAFFNDWITRYALALTKETIGRVRGKYTIPSAPYKLDATQLLSEAIAEKKELEEQIYKNGGLFFATR